MTRPRPTNPAGVLYGTIMIGTLLAAESARQETYAKTVAATVTAMVLYWLVHSYVSFTGERLRHSQSIKLSRLWRVMVAELSIVVGALIPLVELLICWVFGVDLDSAVGGAVWASAAVIVLTEVTAAIRARQRGRDLVFEIFLGGVFGLLIIALRLVLH